MNKSSSLSAVLADEHFMKRAIELAKIAEKNREVPVGAVLIHSEKLEIISEGWNCPISTSDASAHAEVMTIRHAGTILKNYRLLNTTLYVTLEPCLMCLGAILHARIHRVVFGAYDLRAGAIESVLKIKELNSLNHAINWTGGICEEACRTLLQDFFRKKRKSILSTS